MRMLTGTNSDLVFDSMDSVANIGIIIEALNPSQSEK